jgi:hypothetical protein
MKLCVPLWFHRRKRLYPGPLLWFSQSISHPFSMYTCLYWVSGHQS